MLPNLIGQTIGGYRIMERLGQGGNAVVYKAHQVNLNRVVTLKVLDARNREGHERLRRESQVLARFQHANIRQVYGIERHGQLVFAVLEYADRSLKDQLEERRQQNRPFTRSDTVDRLRPIADVLDYLHGHGWVHLDIKPENILVTAEGRVLLADFGVAQPFGRPQTRGTPAYVAPEVVNGESVHAAADIYSLGMAAYEMMALRLPFSGENELTWLRHQTQTLPPKLDAVSGRVSNSAAWVVDRTLAKAPHERYATATGFVDMLQRADTMSVRLPTLPRRRPIATAIAAVLLALILFFTGWWGLPRLFARPPAAATQPLITVTTAVSTAAPISTTFPPPLPTSPALPTAAPETPTADPSATLAPTRSPAPTHTPGPTNTMRPSGPACTRVNDPGAVIVEPAANAQLGAGPIIVRGTADLPDSIGYEFQYRGPADRPDDFHVIQGWSNRVRDGVLGTWDATRMPLGDYTLRLRVKLNTGNYQDCDVPITLR